MSGKSDKPPSTKPLGANTIKAAVDAFQKKFGLGPAAAKMLVKLGYTSVDQFSNIFVPDLLDAGVSWGIAKRVVIKLREMRKPVRFEVPDEAWNEARWETLVRELVTLRLVTWRQVASSVLGAMNPPQVGTAIASNKSFQDHIGKGKTMKAVLEWFYRQPGVCARCGTRINLEADHVKSKQEYRDEGRAPGEADRLENLQLLCKRCNVIKRESHKLGGLSFETAEAALMWILLVKRPRTLADFEALCRRYGLTMSTIRFAEAWATAVWLSRTNQYSIAKGEGSGEAAAEEVETSKDDEE